VHAKITSSPDERHAGGIFSGMANLAQFDVSARSREARIRALLEDLVQEHMGVRPGFRLALAVWFAKAPGADDQYLLELLTGPPFARIAEDRLSLLWKTGSEGPPYANVRTATVDYFLKLATTRPQDVVPFQQNYEVLSFDKNALPPELVEMFRVVTEPSGLIKGWYISAKDYADSKNVRNLVTRYGHARPELGLVKIGESQDFEHCHGVLHVELSQKWLPLSPEGIRAYTYYNDSLAGQGGYFLFEGGSLYEIVKFEVRTAPDYAGRLLGRTPDDRYPEVYLRAVHPPAQPAA
jgi:hypothetical protein